MSQILVLFAHPVLEKSRVQNSLLKAIGGLENITINDLYERYPDFDIDVRREKKLLLAHDIIIWQHPFYWYSSPALLKQWQDLVLEHGWAYGKNGNMLEGKRFLLAVTTGGGVDAYGAHGEHGYPFTAFLPPYRQTALLCKMRWMEPLVLHGARQADEATVAAHVQTYRRLLEGSLASPPVHP